MAAPTDNQVLEKAVGGLPLVRDQGLNTNKAVNLSGLQIDTSGNLTTPAGTTVTLGSTVTGTTGSFSAFQVTTAAASTGGTGSTATLATAGALAGGPAAAGLQSGWLKIYVAGSAVFVPTWS